MRLCAHLADRLHHTSIKVYLSVVGSLHIDYGVPDPLTNCLQLQLLWGIKRHQGSNLPQRQPVTADFMSVLHQSLYFTNPDNVMLWAACCLCFFGFLRAGEFTVDGTFDPTLHLTMADVQVDSSTNPHSFRVFIKCPKTDPFCKGFFIFLGRCSFPLCPVVSLTNYLHLCGPGNRPLFIYQNGTPLSRSQLSSFLQTILQSAGSAGNFSSHSFRIKLQLLLPGRASLTISLRLWGVGLVKLTCYMYMCIHQWKPSFLSQDDFLSRYELLYPSFWLLFLGAVGFGHFFFRGGGGLWLPWP